MSIAYQVLGMAFLQSLRSLSGIESRAECCCLMKVTDYAHGTTDLLGIQIDAAINDGNSGMPFCKRLAPFNTPRTKLNPIRNVALA